MPFALIRRQLRLPLFLSKFKKSPLFWPIVLSFIFHFYWLSHNLPDRFPKQSAALSSQAISVWIDTNHLAEIESEKKIEKFAAVTVDDSSVKLNLDSSMDLNSTEEESKGKAASELELDAVANSVKPNSTFQRRKFNSKNSLLNQIDLEEKKNIAISGQTFERQNNKQRLIESQSIALQSFMREMHQISIIVNIKNFSCELSSTKICVGIPDGLKDHIYKRWADLQMQKVEQKLIFGNKEGVFFHEFSAAKEGANKK
jgi:hypothetical protein